MARVNVLVNCSRHETWEIITTTESWGKWWGASLKDVTPAWQEGAILTWDNDSTSEITRFRLNEEIQLTSRFMTSVIRFGDQGSNLSVLEIEDTPRGGASFSDGGLAHADELKSTLERFKKFAEGNYKVGTSNCNICHSRVATKTVGKRSVCSGCYPKVLAYDIGVKVFIAIFFIFVILFALSIFFSGAINSFLGDAGVAIVVFGFLGSLILLFVLAWQYERL